MSGLKLALGLASLALGVRQVGKGLASMHEATSRRSGNLAGFAATPSAARKVPARRSQRAAGIPKTGMKMEIHDARTLEDRIKYIRGQIAKGMVDPDIYAFARAATSKKCGKDWCVPEKDNLKEMQAIFLAVRNRVRYTSDILGVDTYQSPGKTLKLGGGDCDDYSSLICSLLLTLGIPCRLKVIRTKDSREWNHIYAQGGLPRAAPNRWYTLDASVAKPFDWEAPASMVAESRIFSAR